MAKFRKVNHQIKLSPVMVIGEDGEKFGTMPIRAAIDKAKELGLDLVEVAPQARPPVCKIVDYGKWKYDQGIKEKKQRQKQKTSQLKELRLSPSIETHDIETKTKLARKFLEAGHKVQLKVIFKGRKNAHRDLGFEVVKKMLEDLSEIAVPQEKPKLVGRNVICIVELK